MYFVDREKIESRLCYLEKQINTFEVQHAWNQNDLEKLAFERFCHLCIEIILDVGNAMIDGFIMRDPGSYDDIIDILLDEKVISQEEAVGLKKVISLRKVVVQDYLDVQHNELMQTMTTQFEHITSFPKNIRTYIEQELGPVTAFKPLSEETN